LAVTLSNTPARAIQLPGLERGAGLPRPWDQQWGLRIQQVLAYESDLLEYGDLRRLWPSATAEAEMAEVAELGGMVPAVESGYVKARLVAAHAARRARIESGQDQVVGLNCFQATEPSPLTADADTAVHSVDPAYELAVLADLAEWCQHRDRAAVLAALGRPTRRVRRQPDGRDPGRRPGRPLAVVLRAARGVRRVPGPPPEWARHPWRRRRADPARPRCAEATHATGPDWAGPLRPPLGKPGLDGLQRRRAEPATPGFEVIYAGTGSLRADRPPPSPGRDRVGLSIPSVPRRAGARVLRWMRGSRRTSPSWSADIPASDAGTCAHRVAASSRPPISASPPSSAASST
jgi:(2R)-ethylmalonyl-CoA mutase